MTDSSSLLPALTLRQIHYFVAVAHARSFTQAAVSLSVTQPALTTAIRQVEFLLGGRLFERSSHRLTLTPAGASILPLAERLIHTARGTFDDMAGTVAAIGQTVRIGFIPSVAERLLPALASLRAAHPALRFALADLPNTELLRRLGDGRLDLGVGVDEAHEGVDAEPLFDDEIVVVLHVDDPLARRRSLSWAKLAERELAAFVRGNVSDTLQRTGGSERLPLEPTYRMEYTEPLYALVRNRLAIAVVPRLYAAQLHDPLLVALPVEAPRLMRTLSLLAVRGIERSPQVALCRAWLRREI